MKFTDCVVAGAAPALLLLPSVTYGRSQEVSSSSSSSAFSGVPTHLLGLLQKHQEPTKREVVSSKNDHNTSHTAAVHHRSHDRNKEHLHNILNVPTNNNHKTHQEQCGLYLAPSTIPGAGLGLFAGIDFEPGDEVTPGDAMVPIRDINWHNQIDGFTNQFLWDEYIWAGATFRGMSEPGHDIDGASFGVGAAPNCFFPLINVEDDNVSIKRDNAGLTRQSPAIGSFSPWHDRVSHATTEIPAGEELFVDYGYGYFDQGRQHLYGLIPFLE